MYKTREEVYQNSYRPWLELLQESILLKNFYINLHFSGPLLYWLQDQKTDYQQKLTSLLKSNKIGIIGGLVDEPFIQLSSRSDDVFFQLKAYDQLCKKYLGVSATEWQGIHLVERECGEFILREVTLAAQLLSAPPIYYLDAETFYESHFANPGGDADYCLKHFGFKDPCSKTTTTHIPQEMLYYGLRDEIGGAAFYSVPIHSEHRYRLLKTHYFTPNDRHKITPKQYLFYIKDVLEKAIAVTASWGKQIEPVIVIFEDAEKFGQWSKDPIADTRWMLEFFHLVAEDSMVNFTGLKDYIKQQGILDTYPVRTSLSYPEWDNWTGKRGIRGVTFGDERLRRIIARLRLTEKQQKIFEERVLDLTSADFKIKAIPIDVIRRALSQSRERFVIVEELLAMHFGLEMKNAYALVNRIRHLIYQEDPKWASRHPCYGSAPYYDTQGLAYLEIASRLLENICRRIFKNKEITTVEAQMIDWDFDGELEVFIETPWQTLAIDSRGGCIDYHCVLADTIVINQSLALKVLNEGMNPVISYHSIYKYAVPLVLTETDSQLSHTINPQGGRREQCRNSFRCDLYCYTNSQYIKVANLANEYFHLQPPTSSNGHISTRCTCSLQVTLPNHEMINVSIEKEFIVTKTNLVVNFTALLDKEISAQLYLVPQIVSSITASDEVDFAPQAFISIPSGSQSLPLTINDTIEKEDGTGAIHFYDEEMIANWSGKLIYEYQINTGNTDSFINNIQYQLNSPNHLARLTIEPAVKQYYQGHVFPAQSQQGYHSSGIMIQPYVYFTAKRAELRVGCCWNFHTPFTKSSHTIALLKQTKSNALPENKSIKNTIKVSHL